MGYGFAFGSGGGTDPLLENLAFYAPFEGSFIDKIGKQTPSQSGTVSLVTDSKVGKEAAQFGGGTALLTYPPYNLLANTDMTVSCWINISQHAQYDWFFSVRTQNPAAYNWSLYYGRDTGAMSFFVFGDDRIFSTALPINQWVHLAVTARASTLAAEAYVNGALVNQWSGGSIQKASTQLCIGNRYPGTSEAFQGRLDDIRIYSDVKDAAFIKKLYALGA